MKAITRHKLRKLLKYAFVAAFVAWVLTLFSGDHMGVLVLGAWMLLGLWTGVLEEYLFGRRFRAMAIPFQFLGKVVLVNLFTVLLIGVAWLWNSDRFTMLASDVPYRMYEIFGMAEFYRLLLRVIVVSSIAILVVQVEEWMGRRTFLGFLLGRYERPKAEERVVLTMDLVGSTAIAEKLGDLRYYRFLNHVYSLMTDAVLRNEADIHKYVGDEVIFTWPMRIGIRGSNCLDLYFDVMERIEEHAGDFEREYGIIPEYRASVHGGRVISAQVGHVKRTLDLSGDVMNSVSRMLGLAKAMKVDLLASAELLQRIPDAGSRFLIGEQHVVPVKGKRKEVRVHTVERISTLE
ncbi:MAG: adenylate/guanylate cyclase domain-containing protein [Flavobacteriales bacterium]|nr:adenylate/guanylate cyclase domain-containing protein [Flavobacteriales bacterium]MBL0126980.1 adenylate/guanylate cyclase domain-containing protein [Flavobacteriales bacterium]MCC6938594.1 adenylate/guanylate cyclase domain-containing protein [Flavobacteriales bacterium]